MKKVFSLLSQYSLLTGVALIAVVAIIGSSIFLKNGNGNGETLVVRAGTFVQQVSTSGTVVAADDVELGFTLSGRISRVYVKVGDTVAIGKVLAEIENGDTRAAVLQRQAALEAEEARLRSLEEGTRLEELAVAEAEVESAKATLAQRNQGVIDAIESAYADADDAIRNQLDQFLTNPRTENPKVDFLSTNSQVITTIENDRPLVEAMLALWQTEILSLSLSSDFTKAVLNAQKNLSSVSSLLSAASTALSSAIPSSSTTQSEIDGYVTDIAAARSAINSAISAVTSAATAETSAAAALNTAEKNLALKRAGSTVANIDVQKAQVRVAEAQLADARAALQKTLIVAPFRGVITHVDITPGEIVSPNGSDISMISADALQIETYVPEINIPLLSVGNRATVTLDAYGDDVPFEVIIVSIDPAQTMRDGVSTYRAILQFGTQDPRIRAGMTANITITTQERDDVISIPQGLVISRDGKKFVRVKEGGTTVEREVTTGSVSSIGSVEITSGLLDGDIVVLLEE
ncbi:efflux RND transporter periplasmic adaptor subunit [Candidatus Parcubacteria bacterium]|nr:MAG: efflux RND transporter periplasmic adaptor subunit [Candidatus Parcubacteria bacterium]